MTEPATSKNSNDRSTPKHPQTASETSKNRWKKTLKIPYSKFHIIMIMINRVID